MEDLTQFVNSLPSWSKVLIAFTLLPLYLFKDALASFFSGVNFKYFLNSTSISSKPIDKGDLLKHDFFRLLSVIDCKVKRTDFSAESGEVNPLKREMMVRLISFKMESFEVFFKGFIEAEDFFENDNCSFKYNLMTGVYNVITKYNTEAVKSYSSLGVSQEDSKYFVDSYERYRGDLVKSFCDRLESICSSTQYSNNSERMLAILEVLTIAIEVIPRDVKSLYVLINGRYDKYHKVSKLDTSNPSSHLEKNIRQDVNSFNTSQYKI